ncbi:MAG: hypothetical protein Q8869_00100 [Candidatus Phytoplasma australasiaticum]|nr:hypothetical protein [Candidatus Phytoplasma australasiaticum]
MVEFIEEDLELKRFKQQEKEEFNKEKYKNHYGPEPKIEISPEVVKQIYQDSQKESKKTRLFRNKIISKLPLCDFEIQEIMQMDLFFFYEKLKKLTFSEVEKLLDKIYYSKEFKHQRWFFHSKTMAFEGYDNRYQLEAKFNTVFEIFAFSILKKENIKKWPKEIQIVNDLF